MRSVAALRRGVVDLARHLAADPSEVDAWAERHGVARLTTRSDPTPLDLGLDVARAAAAAGAPAVEAQPTSLTIAEGPAAWSLAVARVERHVSPTELVTVLGGDYVRAPYAGDPADDAEAERRAVLAATAAGLPEGPRDSVEVQERMVCG